MLTHIMDSSVVDDVLASDRFEARDDVGASKAGVSERERGSFKENIKSINQ